MTPEALARLCPDLAGQNVVPLGQGFDATAWAVGETVIRLARDPEALRREARLLALVRPSLTLPVPQMTYHPGPPAFSRHRLLPGVQLLAPVYDALPVSAKDHLAADLARFHAECHALPHGPLRQAGATEVPPWPDPVLPDLPPDLQGPARRLFQDWQALPPEDTTVWGHFDAHGWNMAFDPVSQRLNGIYDFGDSGFGPLHRDLTYSALISPDLTQRLGRAYATLTGFPVDLNRLRILSGAHRLWELAGSTDPAFHLTALRRWVDLWQ